MEKVISFNRRALASQALTIALKTRRAVGVELWQPICIYGVAEKLDVEVRFENISSMEGMYCKEPGPFILITSHRPAGRQRFTCAHELGHHIFDHGTHIDKLTNDVEKTVFDLNEFLAECFAGFFLMPKVAVRHAFEKRNLSFDHLSPTQIFNVANYFGVGYATLIRHMQLGLKLIPLNQAQSLLKIHPKEIRAEMLGADSSQQVIQIDKNWLGRPVDIEVGDNIIAPSDLNLEGKSVQLVKEERNLTVYKGVS